MMLYMLQSAPTMSQYTVVDIGEDGLASLYPLVWATSPGISLDQWLDYARAISEKGGILGLFGPDETPFGFLAYRPEPTLQHGRVLHIDNFVALELGGTGAGRHALHEAAKTIARERTCTSLEIRLGSRGYIDGQSARARAWSILGHQPDSVVFVKPLAASDGSEIDDRPAVAKGVRAGRCSPLRYD